MKLSRSTTILVNIVLILVIAFLIKGLISVPKNVYANAEKEYLVSDSEYDVFDDLLNEQTKKGWSFHSCVMSGSTIVGIFER